MLTLQGRTIKKLDHISSICNFVSF